MVRSPCCSKEGLSRGAWSAMEDMILSEYIRIHGTDGWKNIPKKAGLKRCGKSCRLRWLNYHRPDIKRGNISPDEEELIIRNHISDQAFKLWNVQETWKSSWLDVLVNDSIGDEESERIDLALADNPVKTAATDSLSSMSSLGDQKSPHYDHSGGDAANLADSSFFSNKQSSHYCSLLPSPFVCSTDFTSEDLYRAMEEDYNNEEDKEWIHEFDYLQE
eukprot:PITA_11482